VEWPRGQGGQLPSGGLLRLERRKARGLGGQTPLPARRLDRTCAALPGSADSRGSTARPLKAPNGWGNDPSGCSICLAPTPTRKRFAAISSEDIVKDRPPSRPPGDGLANDSPQPPRHRLPETTYRPVHGLQAELRISVYCVGAGWPKRFTNCASIISRSSPCTRGCARHRRTQSAASASEAVLIA